MDHNLKSDDRVLRNVIRELPLGIVVIGTDGHVESWNHAAEEILGWRQEEVIGHLPPVQFATSEPSEGVETWLRRKDASLVHLRARTHPLRDGHSNNLGTIVVLEAINAGHSIEHDAPEAARIHALEHTRFRELLEAAPDAIIEVDREGLIILINRETEQLFGYKREELLGQAVEILIPNDLRAGHVEHRKRYWAHAVTRPMGTGLQLEGQRKDGARVPVEISLSPVKFEGGFNVLAIIRDVSERRRAEEKLRDVQARHTEELAKKNRELEARNAEIERADRMKSEFLSGMSHELRTPLHTIIGFAELLAEQLEGPLNEKQERFIGHIHKDSQHLLALINDLLDLSKIESGHLALRREAFPLSGAIGEAVSSLQPRAEAKSIRVNAMLAEPIEIYADRLRLRQILYNLLSNAIKFTPAGGEVSVEAKSTDEHVQIAVIDNGIGIPATEQQSVFDKFYQVGKRQAGGHEGTGLGLAITKHLIHKHGGSIVLESEPGNGTRFTFTIPRVPTAESRP